MKITIRDIAGQIAKRCFDWTDKLPTIFDHDLAKKINARGDWRFEKSGPMGSIIVSEYIVISDDVLAKALAYAESHAEELI